MTATIVNPEDLEYIASLTDAQKRAVVAASLSKHRQADTLEPGDPVPPLSLLHLADGAVVPQAELVGARPLVLIFGSYT